MARRLPEMDMWICQCSGRNYSCVLPEGWTINTLTEPHSSNPYNPDIANVFYRAGYIEHWGRGIQKICDACKELGADPPEYELIGHDLRVHFKALQSALIKDSNDPKDRPDTLGDTLNDTLADTIISLLQKNPKITQEEIAKASKASIPTIKRAMKILSDTGRINRIGGKRYGYWETH